MLLQFPPATVFSALLLLSTPALALSPSELPADLPVSQILQLASTALSSGSSQDALAYYDIAVTRDPSNYLTLFRRATTHLSLGRQPQALADFDKILAIKPGFEGALTQRARIRQRQADWVGARKDYEAAGKTSASEELSRLLEAEKALNTARAAEKAQKWEDCIHQAGEAIMVASGALDLRRLRARCRMESGDVEAAMQDLRHVLQINTGATDLALEVSATTFYALGDMEKGTADVRKCLHSDPENKLCGRLTKREKKVERELIKVKQLIEKRQFTGATKLLIPSANGEEKGLIAKVEEDYKELKEQGLISSKAPENLRIHLLEMTCDAFLEVCNTQSTPPGLANPQQMNSHKRGAPFCSTLLTLSPTSRPALLHLAQTQHNAEDYETALRTLSTLKEAHPSVQQDQRFTKLANEAQVALKRSKQKDYYKVLGVDKSSSSKEIKRAYLKLSKLNHPDKAPTAEERPAYEKKMASINEAYEVLSDPELKQRFDNGDDPNDPESGRQGGHGNPFQQGGGPQFVFRQGPGGGGNPFGGGGGMPNFGGSE
jgi:DnaJ family protein C protein 3